MARVYCSLLLSTWHLASCDWGQGQHRHDPGCQAVAQQLARGDHQGHQLGGEGEPGVVGVAAGAGAGVGVSVGAVEAEMLLKILRIEHHNSSFELKSQTCQKA